MTVHVSESCTCFGFSVILRSTHNMFLHFCIKDISFASEGIPHGPLSSRPPPMSGYTTLVNPKFLNYWYVNLDS